MGHADSFAGAKLALFLGPELAVILRDELAGLPFPGYWDLPGGGREGGETPQACVRRECREELGLDVPASAFTWAKPFDEDGLTKWFFVAHLPADSARTVIFGDEGQRWTLMMPQAFIAHPKAVPAFQARLRIYLQGK